MSWSNLSPARIARALSVTLFLALFQVVVAPVVAPQVSTPMASAADANDLPTGLGTVYQFLAESYTSGSTTWPEARGNTAATISASALKVTNSPGTLGASKSVVAVQGSFQTSITFPTYIAYGNVTNPNDYTFLYVARYAPQQAGLTNADYCDNSGNRTTNNAAKKSRIFSSSANNWLSGFWACAVGVAHHMGWLTQYTSPQSDFAGSNGNNWLLGADCGYAASSSSGCNGRYRAMGTDRTTTPSTSTVGHSVVVNGGQFPAEVSDFQIAEVISYPTILPITDIVKVETYLARKYGITLAASAASKLGIHRASVGTNLNEPFSVQPQIAVQDANGQTVTTNNGTIITATVTGLSGRVIGTATADTVQGVATFENLGVDGLPGNSYTITYSSNGGQSNTSETRTFTRGGGSETDTALSLDGTSDLGTVNDLTSSPFDITGSFTIQAWVKPASTCSSWQTVVTKYLSYAIYCEGGFWRYVLNAAGTASTNGATSIKVEQGEWHHIAYTKSSGSGEMSVYYDGVFIQSITTGVTSMTPNNQVFRIGQYTSTYLFNGQVDEVKLYKAPRSADEIKADMHSYGEISNPNLVAYYDLNEGRGSTLYNRAYGSTSATDLSILGSPTWVDLKTVDTTTQAAYTILKFSRTYITSSGGWKAPAGISQLSVLVVAGGGAGGRGDSSAYESGGGGGGGVILTTASVSAGSSYSITVGMGGYGQLLTPLSGQNSSAFSLTAVGGGYGAWATNPGGAGGSGGGGSHPRSAGGLGTSGQGFAGETASDNGRGGGGGGATETGVAGKGGRGLTSNISGSNFVYGDGGGAGWNVSGSLVGGSGNGGTGATAIDRSGSDGVANSGGGGGGAYSSNSAYRGGNGGSGVIVVRYITALRPAFTQPAIDTTTAGLTDTITVSANPISPLTRNYRWQVSTDTGTTWANASTGSGATTNVYTTPILETNTSGVRYQYRVIVTDSDTTGLFIIDTSTAVYIVVNARIAYTGSYSSHKYGSTHQDTFTVLNGTGNKTLAYSPNNRTGIAWSSPMANTAVLTIGPSLFVGTYFETITATDTRGAQTTLGISIVVSKADTITVTAISRTETFTGSTLSFTPTFTVTGLVNSETLTAASMSWSYNGVENSGTLYAIQSTRPTNAGSYMITPVTPSSLTDSYTAVTVVAATLTVNRATRTLTTTAPASPLKFGDTRTITSSLSAGSGDGTLTYSTSTSDSCTVSSTTVQAIKSSGSCSFSAVISRGNNFETATSTSVATTLAKADTLTVTVNAMAPVTYTGAQIGITPSVTVSGLKLTNAVGATPAAIKYAASSANIGACANGGVCAVGDTGPGGGTVFYDAGSQQSWGRYLEMAKSGWNGSGETTARWCSVALANTALNVLTNGIGQGLANSTTIANSCGEGAAFISRNYNGGGKTNWYLPTPAEFLAATQSNAITDLNMNTIVWLSTEPNDANKNWVGQVAMLSSPSPGGNNKLDILAFRPIRAFAAGDTAQSFTSTKPTDADTYTVRASDLALSLGSINDYQGVTYIDNTLRVNRALQSQLFLAEYGATFGTPYRVIVFGGSGTGTAKVSTTSGSATGCTVSGDTLTSTSTGTCLVTAVKAQDKNFETATVTIGVHFLEFVIQQPAPPVSNGPGIALSGATSVTLDPNQAPTISGISVSSGRVGDTVTISGAGFTASALQMVKFWRNVQAAVQGTPTNTQIVVLVPSGATTGKIIVITANGSAITEGNFTVDTSPLPNM